MPPNKPLIFISHSHRDEAVAKAIQDWIDDNLLGSVSFFVSSDQASLPPGTTWFAAINDALENASIVLAVVSDNSVDNPWIFFESGAAAIRQIPLVPVFIGDIKMSELPSPLNHFRAVNLMLPAERVGLLELVANSAGLRLPKTISALNVAFATQSPVPRFDWRGQGIVSIRDHKKAYEELFSRIRDPELVPRQVYLSGASLTEVVHVGSVDLARLAERAGCDSILIIIKMPDEGWSKLTATGMSFTQSYDYGDSIEMCSQSRKDVVKLLGMTRRLPCRVEARECDWPPTHVYALLEYKSYSWGFFEPILHSVNLSSRFCLMLSQKRGESSTALARLRQAFEGLWNESHQIGQE